MSRVVLLDPAGGIEAVVAGLGGAKGVEVVREEAVPAGEGIVAVLVPPEIPVGAAQVADLPDLRIVAATSTGYDHLDLEAIAAAGAWATHCAGYCDEEVAEHAVAFALDLLRGVTLLDRSVRAGAWNERASPPRRIAGAVLGVIGLGRIGRQVAWRARALGMRVVACDPFAGQSEYELLPLAELLAIADVVTLHALLTPGTRGLIGAAELAAMKPGAVLVNVARAALVDHAALGEALKSGHLGGCALDVLPVEPPPADEPAFAWPRTLINPHSAWFSPDSEHAPYRRAGEAVAAVLAGREPRDALARPGGAVGAPYRIAEQSPQPDTDDRRPSGRRREQRGELSPRRSRPVDLEPAHGPTVGDDAEEGRVGEVALARLGDGEDPAAAARPQRPDARKRSEVDRYVPSDEGDEGAGAGGSREPQRP